MAVRTTHHGSHRTLLRPVGPGPGPGVGVVAAPGAVVVAAGRPAALLAPAAELAAELDRPLVALCSRRATAAGFAAIADRWPGLSWTAVDLPSGYTHPLLDLRTSTIRDAKALRLGDLSVKRNLGLLLGRLAGWPSVLFLDDDIDGIDPLAVRRAAAALTRCEVAGLTVAEYPDNSVVCHANRLAFGRQDVFVSGSALLARTDRVSSFFPDVYNEDWLFYFHALTRRSVAGHASVRQLRYLPFADPNRAVAEEFGDTIAEGLVSLLDNRTRLSAANEAAYWRRFLGLRREFIASIAARLGTGPSDDERRAASRSLDAAERRRAAITPGSCAAYVRTWRADRLDWARRLDDLDRPGDLLAALRRLDLHSTASSDDVAPRPPGRTSAMNAPLPVAPLSADTVPGVAPAAFTVAVSVGGCHIDPTCRIAPTAQVGAPPRWLQEGTYDLPGRPLTIAARCDIGPFCVIGDEATIGAECILDAYSLVGPGATVGDRVVVTHRGSIYAGARVGDDCVIGGLVGERSTVGNRSRVFGSLIHRHLEPSRPWDAAESEEGSSVIAEDVFIGWGATLTGVTVGRGSYVCAGATVTKNVPPGTIVTGVNEFHSPEDWKGALGRSAFFAP